MAQAVREVRRHTVVRDDRIEPTLLVEEPYTAARVIYLIGSLIVALLGLRFILALLGASQGSAFVNFVYTTSHPFVAPFFGMFNYHEQFGVSRFEIETLIAILVYGLITWALVQITTIGQRRTDLDL